MNDSGVCANLNLGHLARLELGHLDFVLHWYSMVINTNNRYNLKRKRFETVLICIGWNE